MSRIEKLRQYMSLKADEAVLVHKPSNQFYLSNYRGEGLLLITAESAHIITDFRYVEQAERETSNIKVDSISKGKGHVALANEVIEAENVKKLYYEDDFVTVVEFREIQEKIPGVEFLSLNFAPEELRKVKDESELKALRTACQISCDALHDILGDIKPGMTEKELRLKLEFKMFELGAEALAFNTIVASGINGSLPHAIPTDKKLEKGDVVTIDFGAKFGGYCADMTRNISLGEPSPKLREIFNIVLEAQQTAQNALMPGKVCSSFDKIARDIISSYGYGEYFGHGLGHGVGIDVHESPSLNYSCNELLKPGHIVTVEPGIYLPGVGGVRIENSCEITADGARSMVTAPLELIVL